MTSPFQTELRDRAAAHAREWEAAREPSVGLIEVEATVRRRRRGRGLVAGVGSLALVGLAVAAGYVWLGNGADAGPARATSGDPLVPDTLAALGDVSGGSLVVTVRESATGTQAFLGRDRVLVLDPDGGGAKEVSADKVLDELGSAVDGWPSVSLAAIDPEQSLAVFILGNPTAYVVPTVAVYDWNTGTTIVEDPCASTLQRIPLSAWCPDTQAPGVTDPATGLSVLVRGYDECVGATTRLGEVVAASCVRNDTDGYLVTISPRDGKVITSVPTGIGLDTAPWVVAGKLFVNSSGTDSGPFLIDSSGNMVTVGGGPVAGLGVVEDRLLVQTSSDVYGADSSYGHVLGLWSPATGEFEALPGTSFQPGARVALVEVVH